MKSSESFAESCGYVCNTDDNSGDRQVQVLSLIPNLPMNELLLLFQAVHDFLTFSLQQNGCGPGYKGRDSSGENSSWENWGKIIFHSFILRPILLWPLSNNFCSQVTDVRETQCPFLWSSTWRRSFLSDNGRLSQICLEFPILMNFFLPIICVWLQTSFYLHLLKGINFFFHSAVAILIWLS